MWNFQGSWFCGLEISKSCNIHNFTKFSGVELCFAWNLQGYKEKPKKSQGFFQKFLSSNPLFVFFWNSPFQNNCFELVLTSLAQKEPLTLCQDSISITFMCSINSIGFRKVHTSVLRYQHIGERSTSTWEVKPPPLFSHTPNLHICCKYIIDSREKPTDLQHFKNCFKWY